MTERIPMTAEGKVLVAQELSHLKSIERPKIVNEIEVARGHGDLSENAEYHAAKEKQGQMEARILFLEDQLSRSEVIDLSRVDGTRVVFGVTVKLLDTTNEKEFKYRIVGDLESNLEKGYISISSPIAKALIGKEVGDQATVVTPGGRRELEIVDILIP